MNAERNQVIIDIRFMPEVVSLEGALDAAALFGYQNSCVAEFKWGFGEPEHKFRAFYDEHASDYAAIRFARHFDGTGFWEPVPRDHGRWGRLTPPE